MGHDVNSKPNNPEYQNCFADKKLNDKGCAASTLSNPADQDQILARIEKIESFIPAALRNFQEVRRIITESSSQHGEWESRVRHLESQLSRLPTLISDGKETCGNALGKIQADLKLLGEQFKRVKEHQDDACQKLDALFNIAVKHENYFIQHSFHSCTF